MNTHAEHEGKYTVAAAFGTVWAVFVAMNYLSIVLVLILAPFKQAEANRNEALKQLKAQERERAEQMYTAREIISLKELVANAGKQNKYDPYTFERLAVDLSRKQNLKGKKIMLLCEPTYEVLTAGNLRQLHWYPRHLSGTISQYSFSIYLGSGNVLSEKITPGGTAISKGENLIIFGGVEKASKNFDSYTLKITDVVITTPRLLSEKAEWAEEVLK